MFFYSKRIVIRFIYSLDDKPLKSFILGKAIFTSLSINSYILIDLNVTFTPAFDPFLVLKFDIDFLNFVITGFCPAISNHQHKLLVFFHLKPHPAPYSV